MRDDVIPEHEIRAAVRDHLTPDRHGPRGEGVDTLVADVAGVLDHLGDWVHVRVPRSEADAVVVMGAVGLAVGATWVPVDGHTPGAYFDSENHDITALTVSATEYADDDDPDFGADRTPPRRTWRARFLDVCDRIWWGR